MKKKQRKKKLNRDHNFLLRLIRSLPLKSFKVQHVYSNINLLTHLNPQQSLSGRRDGLLYPIPKWQKLFYFFKARVVSKSIVLTFLAFLHEMNNPLQVKALDKVIEEKKVIATKAIKTLAKRKLISEYQLKRIQDELDQYLRRSLMQRKVIKAIDKVTNKAIHLSPTKDKDKILSSFQLSKPNGGCSGAYIVQTTKDMITDPVQRLLHADQRKVGVFKPFDEEIGGPNNPRGWLMRGTLAERSEGLGLRVGENVHREVAAYIVDQICGLQIVPATFYAKISHYHFFSQADGYYKDSLKLKSGSFQEFKKGFWSSKRAPMRDFKVVAPSLIHKLLILDVIIGNTDRHYHNILLHHNEIAAIDHGRSFGDRHVELRTFYKSLYPHMGLPLDEPLRQTILDLDISYLLKRLQKESLLGFDCLQRAFERVVLLQEAIRQNLLPKDILHLMNRNYLLHLQRTCRPNLENKACEIIAIYKEKGILHHKLETQATWFKDLMSRFFQTPFLSTNEKIDSLLFSDLKEFAPFNGYLCGVGSGMIYTFLRIFEKDEAPKGVLTIDLDHVQFLLNQVILYFLERNENWLLFCRAMLTLKTNDSVLPFLQKVVEEQDERVQPILSQGIKTLIKLFADESEWLSRWRFLKKEGHQRPSDLKISEVNYFLYMGSCYDHLHKMAVEKKCKSFYGNIFDQNFLDEIAKLPGFFQTTSILYLSNIIDHVGQDLWQSYSLNPYALDYAVAYLNDNLMPRFEKLTPQEPHRLIVVDTLRSMHYCLRVSEGVPKIEISDLCTPV